MMRSQIGNKNTEKQVVGSGKFRMNNLSDRVAATVPVLRRPGFLKQFVLISSLLLLMTGCDKGPRDIRMGEQECDHCRMMISEEQFSAQLITEQGRQYAFDAIECMAAFVSGESSGDLAIHGLWVPEFNNPETWLEAEQAVYLQSDEIRSPMAVNISAYAGRENAKAQKDRYSGEILSWEEVQMVVQDAWSGEGRHTHR